MSLPTGLWGTLSHKPDLAENLNLQDLFSFPLLLWCPGCRGPRSCLLSELRQDSVLVEHLQLGHRLLPQVRVKGHGDDGCLLQGEDDEVGVAQTRHSQLTLDLSEVTVTRLKTVDRSLG